MWHLVFLLVLAASLGVSSIDAQDVVQPVTSEDNTDQLNDCQVAANDPFSSISSSGHCPKITYVTPRHIQFTTVRKIDLVIENSLQNPGNISCTFSFADENKTLITEAEKNPNGMSCITPRTDFIPSIPAGEHNITAQLSLRPTNGSDIVSTSFVFFDCNSFTSCTQCVSSDYPCDWCLDGNRCTHATAENCRNDIFITGISQEGPSFRNGPQFCPAIKETSSGSREILVADNSKKAIRVKVRIVGLFLVNTRFVCDFNIEGKKARVNAQLLADMMYCDPMNFTYTSRLSNINASFVILWDGGYKALDNPDNIYVNIYRCRDLADTCGRCVTLDEKYGCGWCRSSSSCEILEQCIKIVDDVVLHNDRQDVANMDPVSWISSKTGNCPPIIKSVTPHHLQRTTIRKIDLVIENLTQIPGKITCVFSFADAALVTDAEKKPNGMSCTTPRTDFIPSISAGEHNITSQLSLRPTNGSDFVSTSFVFFDCNTFTSCTQCVSSEFPCDWCVDANRCTHNTYDNCHNDILVTGINQVGPSYRSGPKFCPAIIGPSSGSREILVADNSKKAVRVTVYIVGQFIVNTRFVCDFNIEGKKIRVNAVLLADTIYCEAIEFSYTSRLSNINASFAILWDGGYKALDNPDNIYVNIYRCRDLADTYGHCLILDKKYGCSWCRSSSSCEILEQCNKSENRAGLHSENQNAAMDSPSRISSMTEPTITSITPKHIQRTTVRSVDLVIENLPQLPGNYSCAFFFANEMDSSDESDEGFLETFITEAEKKPDGLSCITPRADFIPWIPAGKHNITAQLSVRPTNGSDIVSTSFVFFDCKSFSSCTQCVSSEFPCDWCLDGNRCTHDTAENCDNGILVPGISRVGLRYQSGPKLCPAIKGTSSGTREILVADNSKKAVRVKVHIIGQSIVHDGLECDFNMEGKTTRVNAQLLADTIYCDAMEFSYTSRVANINASLAILWDGGHKALDNPDNIYLNIYRCRDLADTCGRCVILDEKYGCGWCHSSNSCEILEQCNKGLGIWVEKNLTCP